jgi:ribosomal protein S18 acetylase RimI-like enzyme
MKYSHFLRLVFDAVSKLGIRISPLFIFKETADPHQYAHFRPEDFKEYEIGFWGPEEIKIMALIPGRQFTENELLNRLREGQRCLGLKKNGKLVAFSWCNLKEFSFLFDRWPLNDDEAYLHDAYTNVDCRGKGIAPYLRYHLCRELENIGRTKLYSLSDYFNTPAVNFKLKLNAKKIKLNLYVDFFGKWHLCFNIKNYQAD